MERTLQLLGAGHDREDVEVRRTWINSSTRKTCEDRNKNQVFSKKIEFTDFPLDTAVEKSTQAGRVIGCPTPRPSLP